jgi:predicted metal-dependent hydrolase
LLVAKPGNSPALAQLESVPYPPPVSHKSAKIAALIESCRGKSLDAHYLGYFECFNRQLFYEAHDVLEELWLTERKGPEDGFYKGLIQFAGAFVHLQKNRLRPAAALFKLSSSYLGRYPARHQHLDIHLILSLSSQWLAWLEAGAYARNPLEDQPAPQIALLTEG